MDHPSEFTGDLAAIYDETRISDLHECWRQLHLVFEMIRTRGRKQLLDVGCGTGRLLAAIPESVRRRWSITGLDSSAAMLQIAQNKALPHVTYKHSTLADFTDNGANSHSFDLILCHWFFHCVTDWQTSLFDVVRLAKPHGIVAWLDEDSTLYRALDQVAAGAEMSDPALHALFQLYYDAAVKKARGDGTLLLSPLRRCGTQLRNTKDLTQCFASMGWSVRPAHEDEAPQASKWTRKVTVEWVINKVLQEQAFTNLRRIPSGVHNAAMKEVRGRIGKAGLPKLSDVVSLEFCARLHYAKQGDVYGPDVSAKKVKGAAELLRPYTLSVDFSQKGRRTDVTLRPITSYFASLLADHVSAEWDTFWKRPVEGGKYKHVRPRWAWVRLASSAEEHMKNFSRSVIFSFPPDSDVFSEARLKAYFSSCIPFVTLAETTAFFFEPVTVRFPGAQESSAFRVSSGNGKRGLGLWVPHRFMHAFVPAVTEFGNNANSVRTWNKTCDEFKKSLCGMRDARRAIEQARHDLTNAGGQLDDVLGIRHFAGRHGMSNLYDLLRGFALFPGRVFCLFAVSGVNRRIGGSLTLAFDDEPSELQVMTLKDVVEALLLIPGVLSTAARSAK